MKVYLIRHTFEVERDPLQKKTCWKFDSCFWFLRKDKKDNSEFVTTFVEIIVTIIFVNSLLYLCYTVFFHCSLETQSHVHYVHIS